MINSTVLKLKMSGLRTPSVLACEQALRGYSPLSHGGHIVPGDQKPRSGNHGGGGGGGLAW